MPCCEEDNADIEEYVNDFVFNYFGFTYVTNILLGGVAQQHITITRKAKERLEQEGVNIKHEASVSFEIPEYGGNINLGVTNSKQNSSYQKFSAEIQTIDTNKFGGDVSRNSSMEWAKSVPRNPVITQFTLQSIFRLLNQRYFPYDSLIMNKSKLIENLLDKQLTNSIFCYDQCGGNGTRGTCEPTGYFGFGICKCKPGWTGPDCGTAEPPKILHGTICGFDRSFMQVNCNGQRPWVACPTGWTQYNWRTDLTVCYKARTEAGHPVHGTVCGLLSRQVKPYAFDHQFGCGTATDMQRDNCPPGYQYQEAALSSTSGKLMPNRINAMCTVTNTTEHSSGTLCGMQIQHTIDGPSCDGHNPGLDQCPTDYALKYTAFNDLGFMTCVKK